MTGQRPLWGVLGGLGPLASAEFLRTVYRLSGAGGRPEREAPRVLLLSDPDLPDRTEAVSGPAEALPAVAARCAAGLRALRVAGADRILICCFTVHAVLDSVPRSLLAGVVRLPPLVQREVAAAPGDALLLATTGAVASGVFHRPGPNRPGARFVVPNGDDQEAVQQVIYRLKRGAPPEAEAQALGRVAARYPVERLVFACTELHLVAAAMHRGEVALPWPVIDPLMTMARAIAADTAPQALATIAR